MSDTPDSDHGIWEARAVAHVVGGLSAAESSAFRDHLLTCGRCKSQVSELRDLAGSLAVAARDERSRQALQVATPSTPEDDDTTREPVTISGAMLAAIVLAVLALGLLVHNNLGLRREVARSQANERVVAGMGQGLVLQDVDRAGAVSGQVVVSETGVSWSFTHLPLPAAGQQVVAWTIDADGTARLVPESALTRPHRTALGGTISRGTATRLVVTIAPLEELQTAEGGASEVVGQVQVEADLEGARVPNGG